MWSNHCLPSLGRLFSFHRFFVVVVIFLIKTPSILQHSVLGFFFWKKEKSHLTDRYQLCMNCDFTDTFAVLTETVDFAEFTDLCSQRTLGNNINIYKYNRWDKSCWLSWQIFLMVICFKFDITQFVRIYFSYSTAIQPSCHIVFELLKTTSRTAFQHKFGP